MRSIALRINRERGLGDERMGLNTDVNTSEYIEC